MFFPGLFDSGRIKEYYDQLKKRTLLELEGVKTGKKNDEAIQKIDEYLLFSSKPGVFSGKNSLEIKYDRQFDDLCILVSEQTFTNARDLTVLTFYNSLEYIKKKAKESQRKQKKNGR